MNANGKRVRNKLGGRDYVTGEMWKSKPRFHVASNKAVLDVIICRQLRG